MEADDLKVQTVFVDGALKMPRLMPAPAVGRTGIIRAPATSPLW